jgi:hypothetical protein
VIKINEDGAGTPGGGGGTGTVIALVSMVTAPFRARALPWRVAPVVSVMELRAKMFPANELLVPRVADDPTCQKMLEA